MINYTIFPIYELCDYAILTFARYDDDDDDKQEKQNVDDDGLQIQYFNPFESIISKQEEENNLELPSNCIEGIKLLFVMCCQLEISI